MAANYDDAVAELYQAPQDSFVAERKRLAAELKAAGDKANAARLIKLGRPPLSAWAVNQLWWLAREPFDRLLSAAERLRSGDQSAAAERRDALAALKTSAAAILVEAGHGANEGTLRRVTTTLAALAASGSFDPDPPGALSNDRDPPGFDAAGLGGFAATGVNTGNAAPAQSAPAPNATPPRVSAPAPKPAPPKLEAAPSAQPVPRAESVANTEQAAQAKERIENERIENERAELRRIENERIENERAELRRIENERKRLERERAARAAERERLEARLPELHGDLERRRREVERLEAEVARVKGLAEQARSAIDDAEKRLSELRDG